MDAADGVVCLLPCSICQRMRSVFVYQLKVTFVMTLLLKEPITTLDKQLSSWWLARKNSDSFTRIEKKQNPGRVNYTYQDCSE